MYDWEDKDGLGKLKRLCGMLKAAGFAPKVSGNKMFVILNHPETQEPVVQAYASSWHSLGVIFIQVDYGVHDVGTTFSVDKAYEMMVNTYKSSF